MCYNLMKEEILVRLQELKADLIERQIVKIIFQQTVYHKQFLFDICYDLKGYKTLADACAADLTHAPDILIFTPAKIWIERRCLVTLNISCAGDSSIRKMSRFENIQPRISAATFHNPFENNPPWAAWRIHGDTRSTRAIYVGFFIFFCLNNVVFLSLLLDGAILGRAVYYTCTL